jgi:hypothetical protein
MEAYKTRQRMGFIRNRVGGWTCESSLGLFFVFSLLLFGSTFGLVGIGVLGGFGGG